MKIFINKTLNNEKGIALLMVMGVVAILTFILADFTYETKINKIKVYNYQDKIQARLNAEAGLNFALAKLRLYQEGRNKIEKDEGLKTAFPSADLEQFIMKPFMFPPPLLPGTNLIQKSASEEFIKKTLFNGELSITFQKISGFLNPNTLRIKEEKSQKQNPNNPDGTQDSLENSQDTEENDPKAEKKNRPAFEIIEKKLVETLERLLKDKNDTDEAFHAQYGNLNAESLVQEIQYYVNDKGKFQGPNSGDIENKFQQKKITPKFGPMTSIDELYLLPSWDDVIVDLIKDRMSVHDVSVISINEITIEDLKILFPGINNIQTEEFFKYRDGDVDKQIKGKKFKNAEDFKNVVTGQLNILNDTEYDERISTLKNAGLVLNTSGKLYKVNSRGSKNNAVYSLTAYIDLPIKDPPKQKNKKNKKNSKPDPEGGPDIEGGDNDPNDTQQSDTDTTTDKDNAKKDKVPPEVLLLPRAVEIRLD